jgi:aminoglycoside 6-adenylyltransferase
MAICKGFYGSWRQELAKGNSGIMSSIDKSEMKRSYEELTERIVKWVETRQDIKAAIVVGSRARTDHPADEWADLDIMLLTTDPTYYISTSDWTYSIGKPLLTFIEPTSTGGEKERRVLFEGMLDVDFAIIPIKRAQQLMQSPFNPEVTAQIANTFGRGIRVLVDKEGKASQFQKLIQSIENPAPNPPTKHEFLELVSDFIYHAVFTAKHLQRGELWWTVTCLNCYMQRLLLRMIEWHALATHDWKHNTWFRGRFLEEWAHPQVLKELRETFAHYDREDIKRALLAAVNLSRWLSTATAEKLGYPYPAQADAQATKWIEQVFQR